MLRGDDDDSYIGTSSRSYTAYESGRGESFEFGVVHMDEVVARCDSDANPVQGPVSLHATEVQLKKVKATPLPLCQLAIVAVILLTESLCGLMLLPFVGYYVAHLQGWPVEDAGYLSGVVVGMFMLGQVVSSKLWGHLSDQYGRKKPLILGLLVGALMMLVFGVSPNIYIACVARLVQGFFSGTILIAKTIVADITDDTNKAKGFALVSLAWGVGSVVGPAIGGFLYDPSDRMGLSRTNFLARYPAFLPGICITAYSLFAWVIALFLLKETNRTKHSLWEIIPLSLRRRLHIGPQTNASADDAVSERLKGDGAEDSAMEEEGSTAKDKRDAVAVAARDGRQREELEQRADEEEDGEYVAVGPGSTNKSVEASAARSKGDNAAGAKDEGLCHSPDDDDVAEQLLMGAAGHDADGHNLQVKSVAPVFSATEEKANKFSYLDAFRYGPSRCLIIMFMLYCASEMTYNEVLPLWAIVSKDVGGLAVSSSQVGTLIIVTGVPSVVANLMFPLICRLIPKPMHMWRVSIVIYAAPMMVVPCAAYVKGFGGYWLVMVMGMMRQFGVAWCFGLSSLLIPMVSKKGHMGAMFGINQSAGALTRCAVPFGAAPLFAWSISSTRHVFPYNHFLLYVLATLAAAGTFVLSYFMHLPDGATSVARGSHHDDDGDDEAHNSSDEARRDELAQDGLEKLDMVDGQVDGGQSGLVTAGNSFYPQKQPEPRAQPPEHRHTDPAVKEVLPELAERGKSAFDNNLQ